MLNVKPFLGRLGAAFILVVGLLSFVSTSPAVHADAGESLTAGRAVAGSLSGGSNHTCLAKNGNVYCWGFNNNFQLGDGTTTSRNTPQMVSGLDSPISVSAGGTQSCAVLSNGLLLCWGNRGGPNPIGAPSKIQNASGPLTNVRYVDLGGESYGKDNGCAITTAGALWCWGANDRGQVGDGTTDDRINAVQIIASNVIAVSVGINHSCAVLQSGVVQCWGANNVGQLGDGLAIDSTSFSNSPQAAALSGAVGISVNGSNSCALINDGTVKCWGSNSNMQLGSGLFSVSSSIPTAVVGLSGAIGISTGGTHACALLSNGTVMCWGNSNYRQGGRLGSLLAPGLVEGITNATAVTAGLFHTCALIGTNDVKCWGDGSNGILGDGVSTEATGVPVSIAKKVEQSITASSISAKTVNDTTISLAGVATSDSGVSVTYSNISGNEGVCNVSGTSLSILGAGRCKVQIDAPS